MGVNIDGLALFRYLTGKILTDGIQVVYVSYGARRYWKGKI